MTRNDWPECDSCPRRTEGSDVACKGCQDEAIGNLFINEEKETPTILEN